MEEEKCISKVKKIFAPFTIIKKEKSYLLWIFIIFFGLINLWVSIVFGNFIEVKKLIIEGQLYTFSIALCAPFFITFILDRFVTRGYREEEHFVKYKEICKFFNFVWIFIMGILWVNNLKISFICQIVITIISIVFSYYMFCVGEMSKHCELIDIFDDREYKKIEDNKIRETRKNAKKLKKIKGEEGEIQV